MKVFVVSIGTVCLREGIPEITGGSSEGSVILKKKSSGIRDFTVPLSSLSSPMITATQRSPVVVDTALFLTSHLTVLLGLVGLDTSTVNI